MDVDIKMVAADPQGRNRFSIKAARQEKGLPPLQPLSGVAVPAGAPAGGAPAGGPGGEQRFRDSRPPRPGGPGGRPPGPPGGGGRGPGGPPRRDN